MDSASLQPVKALGPETIIYEGSFATNASSNPTTTDSRYPIGLPFTVVYAATGTYTVTVPIGLALPAQPFVVACWPQFATLATDWFECAVLGETTLTTTTRSFVIQAHRNGTAREPAALAGNRINFAIIASNSTGR